MPELLAPAGNLEKLKIVVAYGADAVYLGGKNQFGLRAASENFSNEELKEATELCHANNVKVYVVLNSFFHDKDLNNLRPYLKFLEEINIDAVIVSDLGVVNTIRKFSSLEIHLSTQSSCLNAYSAKFWKKQGVTRIVLGREVGLEEAKEIKKIADIELEMFIHGSMCMAYSGNCVISNYTSGRDSNRGGCAHSCRFEYELSDGNTHVTSSFMSSKDLWGISLLKQYQEAGIDSLKIEGRMKGPLYAGTITKAYADALRKLRNNEEITNEDYIEWEKELQKVSHREYTHASLLQKADSDSVYTKRLEEIKDYHVVGVVADVVPQKYTIIEVRKAFLKGERLEVLPFKGKALEIDTLFLKLMDDVDLSKSNPGTLVKIPWAKGVEVNNIVRKREGL